MINVEKQTKIFDSLASILDEESQDGYTSVIAVFSVHFVSSDERSVGIKYRIRVDGGEKQKVFSPENSMRSVDEVLELHQLMKEHTGGAWSEMTLTLTADGQLKTDFKYPDAG